MSVFVKRKAGVITAVFANPQPGMAEEELPENHAEVISYREKVSQTTRRHDALEEALVAKGVITRQEIDALRRR